MKIAAWPEFLGAVCSWWYSPGGQSLGAWGIIGLAVGDDRHHEWRRCGVSRSMFDAG